MLQTRRGAADAKGIVCGEFVKGFVGEVLDSTADVFVREGWAVYADDARDAGERDLDAVAAIPDPDPVQPVKRKPGRPRKTTAEQGPKRTKTTAKGKKA
jgi:hypothetical protein